MKLQDNVLTLLREKEEARHDRRMMLDLIMELKEDVKLLVSNLILTLCLLSYLL